MADLFPAGRDLLLSRGDVYAGAVDHRAVGDEDPGVRIGVIPLPSWCNGEP
jgi:hypothetical protein